MKLISALVCAVLSVTLILAAEVPEKVRTTLNDSTGVFTSFATPGEQSIPPALLDAAKCIAAFPNVTKGAFIFGGQGGAGTLSCRLSDGKWSPPLMISIGAASVGFQIGVEKSDMVLVFLSTTPVKKILSEGLTFGGNATAAAGPYGAKAIAPTNTEESPVYLYSRTEGLMASAALNGSSIKPSTKNNQLLYDKGTVEASAVLMPKKGETWPVPAAAQGWVGALDKYAPKR